MRPALTTVRVRMSELGAVAIELLHKRLLDPELVETRVTLQSELIIRESCGRSRKVDLGMAAEIFGSRCCDGAFAHINLL